MHLDHQVPVLLGDVAEGFVTQDASVADQDVDLAIGIQGGLQNILAAGHGGDVVPVGHSLATSCHDLVDDLLGSCAGTGSGSVARTAQIVDNDGGTLLGEEFGVGLTQTTACASDDRNLALKQTHDRPPIPLFGSIIGP